MLGDGFATQSNFNRKLAGDRKDPVRKEGPHEGKARDRAFVIARSGPGFQTPNTKHRSRRIISHSTVPGFGRNTPGTEAVSLAPSKSIAKSTRLSRPR